MIDFDAAAVTTPCFVVDERLIAENLKVLARVKQETGCRILLALKGYAMSSTFPLIRKELDGTCASSVHEAILGHERFGGEVHAFAAAFSAKDVETLMPICDHLVFNSFSQWERFRKTVAAHPKPVSCGMRVNPEKSMGATPIYDPCAPGSRLGVRREAFREDLLHGIEGLHFHALCEQDSTDLKEVLEAFETTFGKFLPQMTWVNFGGGHHITRKDYDVGLLIRLINDFQARHPHLTVYLEPGEAIALNAGFLVSEVLDITRASDMAIAILDTSASCHMPDVLEMPYRPFIIGSGKKDEKAHTYRLGGLTCLAGDIIGEYSFDEPLKVGDRLVFTDMAIYSMVKTNTFNGIGLPSIYRIDGTGTLHLERTFGYDDFVNRLA
ncbi:carboxynorspermidine decarboxylase [Desulfoluna butyratoxydans]|uniref:Carboxynorspermidine/carboxyspermidine decarboxylase n=1 Tax=Desulfoluna butyratoxydans TaxID=231438 RepID=A0A4U8YS53_9BACT|nr:carboxynorspermidine decarboxylase [Desulfoluna butyratoxydans]VFQ46574.1 carboxynorspermidine decarboxylase [Desulfoluna butyratoxydans]